MFRTLYLLLKSARPRQAIKNLALFAPLIFRGLLLTVGESGTPYFAIVVFAFVVFSLMTSSVYILNDIFDYEADRNHPFKRKRPIASGELSLTTAKIVAALGIILAFALSFWLSLFFKVLLLSYLVLQLLYSSTFKHIPILDVVSIATGFLIRVYAGSAVLNVHMSVWFLLTVISASLFLAVGKRQSERTLLKGNNQTAIGSTRKILRRYSQRLLDQYTSMFANATWLSYAIFTFQSEDVRPSTEFTQFYTFLPKAFHSEKLLMLSLPFVIVGVMRYLQLVYESNKGESPERVLLNDKPLLGTVFAFGLVVLIVLYVLPQY